MAITYEYVGKTGGGASWETAPIPAKTCSGEYVGTDIFTMPAPPPGKNRIVRVLCEYARRGGYPTSVSAGISASVANSGLSQLTSVMAPSSGSKFFVVGTISADTTLRVVTYSKTGSISVSGTMKFMDFDPDLT